MISVSGTAAYNYGVTPDTSVWTYKADVKYAETVPTVVKTSTYMDLNDTVVKCDYGTV